MTPTSWRVREGGGAVALMPRCHAARTGLVRLVGRSEGVVVVQRDQPCRGLIAALPHVCTIDAVRPCVCGTFVYGHAFAERLWSARTRGGTVVQALPAKPSQGSMLTLQPPCQNHTLPKPRRRPE